MMKTFGLALSGGGLRGLAHVGVLQALDELDLKPSAVAGVSAGAIAGAFYCAGYSPAEIFDICKKEGKLAFRKPHWPTSGLFSLQKLEDAFTKYLGNITFEELKIPFYVIATDILKGEQAIYSSGNIIRPIVGSSAIPAVFDPVELDGRLLVDGGILNNLPIEPLKGKCDKIIGVYVNPLGKDVKEVGMKDMIDRSVHLLIEPRVHEKMKETDLVIQPPELTKYRMFDSDKMEEIRNIGYHYTMQMKHDLLNMLGE